MSQPLNFRNTANTTTYATVTASTGGILNFRGNTTNDPCFFQTGRLLPLVNTSNATSLTLDLSSNNNHHLTTTANISTINLKYPIIGQSGHIVIKNSEANTHTVSTTQTTTEGWRICNLINNSDVFYDNGVNIKWQGGSAPTMSTTSGSYDIISYYCYSTTEILLASSTGHS